MKKTTGTDILDFLARALGPEDNREFALVAILLKKAGFKPGDDMVIVENRTSEDGPVQVMELGRLIQLAGVPKTVSRVSATRRSIDDTEGNTAFEIKSTVNCACGKKEWLCIHCHINVDETGWMPWIVALAAEITEAVNEHEAEHARNLYGKHATYRPD